MMNIHKPSTMEDQISQVWDFLIGNGTPGLIEKHDALVERFNTYIATERLATCPVLSEEHKKRQQRAERKQGIIIGSTVGVVVLCITILFGWIGPKVNEAARGWEKVSTFIEDMELKGD